MANGETPDERLERLRSEGHGRTTGSGRGDPGRGDPRNYEQRRVIYGRDRPGQQILRPAPNPPLGSMKRGGKVRSTGTYRLHKGERVLSKRQLARMFARGQIDQK